MRRALAIDPTMRLYYSDSFLRQFTGRVLETFEVDGHPAVVLDQTAFYPTSGGQPHDTGTFGTVPVLNVTVRDTDNQVVHHLAAPLDQELVEGTIDWPRRFDHMQQHSGQHVLSQAFIQIASADTIGFHLGEETVSIDLAATDLSDQRVAEAERLANEVVNANLPVRAWFPESEELAALPLRKRPDVAGPVRVVAMGDFDLNACGGTHVAATGEIGLIAILRSERLKRGTRIEFLCGNRARADYAGKHALVRELSQAMTCAPNELGQAITRVRDGLKEAQKQLAGYHEQELAEEADRLAGGAREENGLRVVSAAWEARPIEDLRTLALRITATPGRIALFGLAGERSQLLFAKSEGVGLDLNPGFRRTLDALGGGRGGGSRILQGSAGQVLLARLQAILAEAAAGLGSAG